jgi:hypothetical protein
LNIVLSELTPLGYIASLSGAKMILDLVFDNISKSF